MSVQHFMSVSVSVSVSSQGRSLAQVHIASTEEDRLAGGHSLTGTPQREQDASAELTSDLDGTARHSVTLLYLLLLLVVVVVVVVVAAMVKSLVEVAAVASECRAHAPLPCTGVCSSERVSECLSVCLAHCNTTRSVDQRGGEGHEGGGQGSVGSGLDRLLDRFVAVGRH